jgi:heme oxygenase
MSFFSRLRAETEGERQALFAVPQIVDGLGGRILRETYLAYLGQAYHHVRHTVPLMKAAQGRLAARYGALAAALDGYMEEEEGHEAWILSDIAAAGGDADAAAASTPNAATAALVAYAYRAIAQVNPLALFGMIFVLEDTSAAIASQGAAGLAAALGLGPECFRYLSSHGALDQEHLQHFARLTGLIDDPADQQAVIDAARDIYRLFAELFRSIPHERKLAHAS